MIDLGMFFNFYSECGKKGRNTSSTILFDWFETLLVALLTTDVELKFVELMLVDLIYFVNYLMEKRIFVE